MSNLQQERKRPPEPKIKKRWQRIMVTSSLGIILGIGVRWALSSFDPERTYYTHRWRRESMKLALKITSPENWFWIVVAFYFLIGIVNEFYLRGYWPYDTKLDKAIRRLTEK